MGDDIWLHGDLEDKALYHLRRRPRGGYVYFYREREAGWYKWERGWFQEPTYTKVDGQVARWWDDGVERIGVVPHDYETDDDEDITIMDDDIMQQRDDE